MSNSSITRRVAIAQCETLMAEAATLRLHIRKLALRNVALVKALVKAKAKPMRQAKRKAVRK